MTNEEAPLGGTDYQLVLDIINSDDDPAGALRTFVRQEVEAALGAAADEMESVIANGDVAEVAAPVPGETGRASAVAKRDALYEEPHTWLRSRAAHLRAEGGE